jgi:hypothetical protein
MTNSSISDALDLVDELVHVLKYLGETIAATERQIAQEGPEVIVLDDLGLDPETVSLIWQEVDRLDAQGFQASPDSVIRSYL